MKDELITFETAKLAKEKRFGLGKNDYIILPTAYELNGNLYNDAKLIGLVRRKYNNTPNHLGAVTQEDFEADIFMIDNSLDEFILAPTQSLLQKWLREIHKIDIKIERYSKEHDLWLYQVEKYPVKSGYNSYEETLEAGLQEALNLIKDE